VLPRRDYRYFFLREGTDVLSAIRTSQTIGEETEKELREKLATFVSRAK